MFYPSTVFLAEWKEVETNVGLLNHLFLVPQDYTKVGLRDLEGRYLLN